MVYVKPSAPPLVIPRWSYDPRSFKKSAFDFYFKRCIMHCSDRFLRKVEIDRILEVGRKHGYAKGFLRKLYRKAKVKFLKLSTPSGQLQISAPKECSFDVNTCYTIPYRLHNSKEVKSSLRSANRNSAFRRAPTVFEVIRNDKSKRQEGYKVPLKNIEDNQLETYIGTTVRNFKQRIKEHKESIRRGDLCTALAQRVFEKNAEVLWQNAKVIKSVTNR